MSDRSDSRPSNDWLRLGEEELAGANALLANDALEPRLSVVLAAQAAEKALKAALASIGVEPPRSHDLVALARRCGGFVRLTPSDADLRRLADAHQEARYPDSDETTFDVEEATELFRVAETVVSEVAAVLSAS